MKITFEITTEEERAWVASAVSNAPLPKKLAPAKEEVSIKREPEEAEPAPEAPKTRGRKTKIKADPAPEVKAPEPEPTPEPDADFDDTGDAALSYEEDVKPILREVASAHPNGAKESLRLINEIGGVEKGSEIPPDKLPLVMNEATKILKELEEEGADADDDWE